MRKNFKFDKPQNLPTENIRDLINLLRQNIKFKLMPFRAYYRLRAKKYARKKTPELNLVKYLITKNKNSLDVGANLGLFTYFMSKYSKFVYAIEPNPEPLRYLYDLVDKNVEIMPIAASNKDDYINLIIPKSRKGWSSNGASLKNKNFKNSIELSILSKKIDSLNLSDIGLIKIDVEGHEKEVIEGAAKTIITQKPNIIIENETIHHEDPFKVFDLIKNFNYEIFYCDKNLKLKKITRGFEFTEQQKNPEIKVFGYIQNFICIHIDSIKTLNKSPLFI